MKTVAVLSLTTLITLSIILLPTDAEDKYCQSEQECFYEEMSAPLDNVFCEGYGVCEWATISNVANSAECNAEIACKDATIVSHDQIYCTGHHSCKRSKLSADKKIKCLGDSTCESAELHTPELLVTGYFGAEYSSFFSTSETATNRADCLSEHSCDSVDFHSMHKNMSIVFDDYKAGYFADIYCNSGSKCTVQCQDHPQNCETLYVYCLDGAHCDVRCNGEGCDCLHIFGSDTATMNCTADGVLYENCDQGQGAQGQGQGQGQGETQGEDAQGTFPFVKHVHSNEVLMHVIDNEDDVHEIRSAFGTLDRAEKRVNAPRTRRARDGKETENKKNINKHRNSNFVHKYFQTNALLLIGFALLLVNVATCICWCKDYHPLRRDGRNDEHEDGHSVNNKSGGAGAQGQQQQGLVITTSEVEALVRL